MWLLAVDLFYESIYARNPSKCIYRRESNVEYFKDFLNNMSSNNKCKHSRVFLNILSKLYISQKHHLLE